MDTCSARSESKSVLSPITQVDNSVICDQRVRIDMLASAVERHSERIERLESRVQQVELFFVEIRKDLERLAEELRGIRSILAWLGSTIGIGVFGVIGTAIVWAIVKSHQ